MSFAAVEFAVEGATAWITLSRPDRLNALNVQMRDDLYQVLSAVRDDDEIRTVVFKGAGDRAFCAGADLTEFGTAPSPVAARQIRTERDLWGMLAYFPKVLIAAIHGFCLGSGLELSCLCDLRLATDDAVFGLPEVSLGFIPAAGGSQSLPRVVGRAKALELALLAERIAAAEALRIGLVHRLVPRADLYPAATAWADRINGLNPAAVLATKQAVLHGQDVPLGEGIALESRLGAVVKGRNATR